MQIEKQKLCLDVRGSDLSGSRFNDVNISGCDFDNVNMSGWRVSNVNLAGLHITNANLAGAAIADARLEGATIEGIPVTDLLAFFEKNLPALRNYRLEAGLCKIIETAADNLFPRETQELAGADTGLQVTAIVVGEQNRFGGMKHERPEKQLEFPRAVFREPTISLWLRGHYAFLLRTDDPGRRLPGEHVAHVPQNSGNPRMAVNGYFITGTETTGYSE